MPTPAGITRRLVSFGTLFGNESDADLSADVTVIASEPLLVWDATGDCAISDPYTVTLPAAGSIEIPLIPTDLEGWTKSGVPVSASPNPTHVYTITIQPRKDNVRAGTPIVYRNLVVPSGAGVLDADKSAVWTGPSGVVTGPLTEMAEAAVAAAAADLLETNDVLVEGFVSDPGSVTRAALNALFVQKGELAINLADYGAVGDGVADDTTAWNNAIAAATGKVIHGQPNAVYRVTSTLTMPTGATFISHGATFKKDFVSTNPAVRVGDRFMADVLSVTCVGSSSAADRAIHVQGSNGRIGRIYAESLTADQDGGGVMGVTIGTSGSSAWYDDVQVDAVKVKGWRNALMLRDLRYSRVDNIEVDNFRTGVYLIRCQRSTFKRAWIHGTSASANGTAGQNGLLVELLNASGHLDYETRDLRFEDWDVDGAPEHGFRIGGDMAVTGIHFVRCISRKAGNAAGNVATGGSGFKALGVSGHHHKDLHFVDCVVEDSNPNAAGVNNFAGWHLAHVDGVTLTNPKTQVVSNTECGRHGIVLFSATGILITNPDITKVQRKGFYIIKDGADPAPMDVSDVVVQGGRFGSMTDYAVHMDPQTIGIKDVALNDVQLVGNTTQVVVVRQETVGAGGSYVNVYLGVNYRLIGAAGTTPPLDTRAGTFIDYRGPLFGSFGITAENGSVHQDTTNGAYKIRKGGAWVTL